MSKPAKQSKRDAKTRSFYALHPWECHHLKDHSVIVAYVEASGNWENIATIHATSGNGAETIAQFICGLVNEHQKNRSLLQEAMEALQLCLEDDHLTFSSEQAADHAVTRIKARIA
jgi:hemerythrin-like domain-containing protein